MAPGDAAGLAVAVVDGQLWRLNVASAPTPDRVSAYIEEALADRCRRPFTVFSAGRIVGTTSYYNILPQVARLEIGHTWYARSVQRTAVNTACKVALLDHAFGPLGARVVGWRTDLANTVSQRAIERLGALRDGVIRGDRLRKDGTIRDTVVYSMTAAEWAIHRARLVQ
ncbi:MAG: GNAT family protein [Propionibacteriaceae bacterium]|nr:GNAT family protein [Propionibacteriaceae bacterium]